MTTAAQTTKEAVAALQKKVSLKRRNVKKEAEALYLSVQLLAPKVMPGALQKHRRIGALVTVVVNEEGTLENIKKACAEHFNETVARCEVFKSDRGPSIKSLVQLNLKKDIYVVFRSHDDDAADAASSADLLGKSLGELKELKRTTANSNASKPPSFYISSPIQTSTKQGNGSASVLPCESAAVSLNTTSVMRLGKAVAPSREVAGLALESFNMATQKWDDPVLVKFLIDKEKFDSGGFRDVYRMKCLSGPFKGKQFVLKLLQDDKVRKIVDELNLTEEEHVRTSVQLHMLSRNFAKQMAEEATPQFGENFKYEKPYFVMYKSRGWPVAVELDLKGAFTKYINNDGQICYLDKGAEMCQKAEAFTHFTYTKSSDSLMVLDIQGVGYTLSDPEISTKVDATAPSDWAFCLGNCKDHGLTTFLAYHNCGKYCTMLKLDE